MEDIDAFLVNKEPLEAASISAVHLVHTVYLMQLLTEQDARDSQDIILNKVCATLPASIDRVYSRLADEAVWNDLCMANDYAVVVSEHVAENYAGAAAAIGLEFHRAILRVIDEDSYFATIVSDKPNEPCAAIDCSKVKARWDDVVSALRKIPKVDTFLLRVQIKKEFQRTTNGKQLPHYDEGNVELNFREQCIVDSLGKNELTGQEIADKSGYPFNSRLRQALADMVKNGLLVKGKSGQRYRRP